MSTDQPEHMDQADTANGESGPDDSQVKGVADDMRLSLEQDKAVAEGGGNSTGVMGRARERFEEGKDNVEERIQEFHETD